MKNKKLFEELIKYQAHAFHCNVFIEKLLQDHKQNSAFSEFQQKIFHIADKVKKIDIEQLEHKDKEFLLKVKDLILEKYKYEKSIAISANPENKYISNIYDDEINNVNYLFSGVVF